ncbi:MAG: hypothetical protein GF364_10925, partial [Candidatus Lokiarchaeota archaeon]|nr:hypothetical protein [Candidatus Lokiarchaeota archaeon]
MGGFSITKRQWIVSILLVLFTSASIGILYFPIKISARAVIVSPRLSCAMQGPRTFGPGLNSTTYLQDTITFWVAPDPYEVLTPIDWKRKENWDIALTPTLLPNASCISLDIMEIIKGVNTDVVFGGSLDVNILYRNAVGIVCKVPANIPPLTYNLAIGFKEEINPAKQSSGEINLMPSYGSWQGKRGTASYKLGSGTPSFILTEPNCVYFPWYYDIKSSDSIDKTNING